MKFIGTYCVYDIKDEDRFTDLEKVLAREARIKVRDVFARLCEDFGISEFPQIPVYFYNGEALVGNSLVLDSFGATLSATRNGKTTLLEIYLSLPHLVIMTEDTLSDTIPHEVAHAFADFIYGDHCKHDKRWAEVMRYLNLPAREFMEPVSMSAKSEMIGVMKFHTTIDAMKWAKEAEVNNA